VLAVSQGRRSGLQAISPVDEGLSDSAEGIA